MRHSINGYLALIFVALATSATATPPTTAPSPYASITPLQQQLDAGTLNSAQLTQLFTTHIRSAPGCMP